MPCSNHRADELVRRGKAVRRFNRGIFYIKLTEREEGVVQPVVVGIDPGSKKEGFTVKSSKHTFLNIQADAVTWVKENEERSTMMRRGRRNRNCPCRQPKLNRKHGGMSPSIRARWGWKLRIARWLAKMYPISTFVVEDICAPTKQRQNKWNRSFSPLEVGKNWFYLELASIAFVITKQGWETKNERDRLGLKKLSNKMSSRFEAHCVDSWALANMIVGNHFVPDDKQVLFIAPFRFHRRQLHVLQPKKGVRKPHGGTMSLGIKRGTWIKYKDIGLCYVGGNMNGKISLHSMSNGKRLTKYAKVSDCILGTRSSWRLWTERSHIDVSSGF